MAVSGDSEEPLWHAFGRNDHIMEKMFNIAWQEDAYASSGMFYSLDYGPLHFIGLRTNDVYNGSGVLSDGQIEWLKEDVAAARMNGQIKWIVVMMHESLVKPSFTGADADTNDPTLGGQLLLLFDELDIDLVLAGHNYYTSASWPLVWDENAAPLPYTDRAQERYPDRPLAKELTVRAATLSSEKYLWEGDTVDRIIYEDPSSDRGTVYYQCMSSGMQFSSLYARQNLNDLLLTAGGGNIYRMLASGGAGMLEVNGAPSEVPYSGYSYIQVTENGLTVRSYGVNAQGVYRDGAEKAADHTVYIDGFMLVK